MSLSADTQAPDSRTGLLSFSFACLVATQFLGTLNDNLFRWLAVKIAEFLLGGESAPLALSTGLFAFTLPFLLFASHAGYFADRFSKRTVIVACKTAELVIAGLCLLSILSGQVAGLLACVFLLGTQTALFGPAKFGSLPEQLRAESLSLANGIMGLATVTSAALGSMCGFWLYDLTGPTGRTHWGFTAASLLGIAGAGWLCSLGVRRVPAGNPRAHFPINPVREAIAQLRLLGSTRSLFRTALGIAFFWTLASLAQMNIEIYGHELDVGTRAVGGLMLVLVLGVGSGSVLAGIWSAGKVELGLVPLGALGIVASSIGLFLTGSALDLHAGLSARGAYIGSCLWLFVLGVSSGLFSVPLDAFLQNRSPPTARGSILAASNFLSFSGMLLTALAFYFAHEVLRLDAKITFLIAGLGTIPVALYVFLLLPDATMRCLFWLATRLMYRIRVVGMERVPETGGALIVPNHVSWVDGVLLLVTLPRPVRFVAFSDNIRGRVLVWMARIFRVIPINNTAGPKSILRSLQTAREAVTNGDVVCIFAEGSLTRTGQMQPFQRGMLKIIEGTSVPIIPAYLDGMWGSIFSFSGGKFFWKWPKSWPYPVTLAFGPALSQPRDVQHVQRAVQMLGADMVEQRQRERRVPPREFLRRCRRAFFRPKIADSLGQQLTGSQLLLRSLALARLLRRRVLDRDEQMVGVLLPPSVAGVLVNAALVLLRRVPVNLNYTVTADVLESCVAQCGIRHVLTSRKFAEKLKLRLSVPLVHVEDLKDLASTGDKLVAAVQAYLTPVFLLERWLGLTRIGPDDLLTVIFTSGSTGEPKGVMLSMCNVASNIDAIDALFHLDHHDVMLGVLPFFHSFGFTATLWTVLTLEPKGAYHFNPLDARQIGSLCADHKVTILMCTPTFLRTYLKRCEAEQLRSIDVVVVGAEKLPLDLAQAFYDKFGVRPIEGYGTTELSPLAAVNVPDHRSPMVVQTGTKEGSVGRPIPGTAVKIVDPDTRAELPAEQPGLLLIKGPNVMRGYLNRPELTEQVVQDGWYVTGDIARIDAEGFIHITDRLSRFSKIGGEMVPHIKIEEVLDRILHSENADAELRAVVTSVPDEKKGERLVVIHKPFQQPFDEVYRALSESGLPNLWVPSRDSFLQVDEIPVLGTGKLDLKGLKELALRHFASRPVAAGV